MKKIKLLFVTVLFIIACYLIYNMKNDVGQVNEEEEVQVNDFVIVKKVDINSVSDNYYVEFNFLDKETILYKKQNIKDNVRDGEVISKIYKQANLYLNDIELDNYKKNLNKIYSNPYRYSYINDKELGEFIEQSYYYEIEYEDTKYFVYDENEYQLFDKLFE